MRKIPPHVAALLLLLVSFVAVNLTAHVGLRTARLDLTQNALFTLSDGTRNILGRIDEPITLTFYYSRDLAATHPVTRIYAQRVRDMLEEMVNIADGRLRLEIVDPAPFSEAEDQAVAQGLLARPLGEGELVYFGLIGTNRVDDIELIPYFGEARQEYLEYDLARLIHNLSTPEKPVLGVLSNLPLDTGAGGLLEAMAGRSKPFLIYTELVDRFRVEFLRPDKAEIPGNVDVLLIAHPRPLDDSMAYAVDQFVMRGGRVIAFVDPHSEVSLVAGADGQPLRGATERSDMPRLLAQWGVAMEAEHIVADAGRAQRVAAGSDLRRAVTDYVLWLGLGAEDLSRDDPVTADIDQINLATAGALKVLPDATTRVAPLVMTSDKAALFARDYVLTAPAPEALARRLEPTGTRYMIAARINGRVETAFPDGRPSGKEGSDDAPHRKVNPDANIIVFADSDIFDDRFWVRERNYLGQRFGVPVADNAKFVLNAVDNMMGSNDLIGLRGRERVLRPFTRVEALARAAEAEYLVEEEALIARIAAAQEELDRIERAGARLAEADAAARRHRAELVAARKALRRVQGNLRRDIDRLGAWIGWLNIAAVPTLVGVAAAAVAYRRRSRAEAGRG